MIINATEFQNNVGKYLQLSQAEEIIITRNGKRVAKLVPLEAEESPITDSLGGILKGKEIDLEQIRHERIDKRANPS